MLAHVVHPKPSLASSCGVVGAFNADHLPSHILSGLSSLPYRLSPSARGLLSLCVWAWKCETGVGAPTVTSIPWGQELMDK